jgi:hypothetical protein
MTEQERFAFSKGKGNTYEDIIEEKIKVAGAKDVKRYPIKSDKPARELVGEDLKNWKIQKEYGDISCRWNDKKKRFFYDTSNSKFISKSKIIERSKTDYFIQNINGQDWIFPRRLLEYFAREDWYCKNGLMDLGKIVKSPDTEAEKLEDYLKEMGAENGRETLSD